MKRMILCGLMLALLGVSTAYAMPGATAGNAPGTASGAPGATAPMGGKFAAADTDKDGFLNKEEFAAAFPGLKPEAFTLIDKDGDGRISAQEWGSLSMGHGAQTPPPAGQENKAAGTLPVVPIPQGAGK